VFYKRAGRYGRIRVDTECVHCKGPLMTQSLSLFIRSQTRRFVWYHRVRNAAIIASERSDAKVAANLRRHAGSGLRGSHQLGKAPIRPFPTRIHLQTCVAHNVARLLELSNEQKEA